MSIGTAVEGATSKAISTMGRSVKLTVAYTGKYDTATGRAARAVRDITVKAILEAERRDRSESGQHRATTKCHVAAASLDADGISVVDWVTIGTQVWKVTNLQPIEAQDRVVLYTLTIVQT